jgi:cytochrome c oxidase subunit 2
MLAPGLIAWNQYVTVPDDAAVIEATGQQWQWGFRFPGQDGVLGTAAVAHINADNPFGLNPLDPYGKDDVLVETSELHMPLGKPVKMVLRSKDVLHDFYVPQFRAKMDLVPGIVTYFWVTPTRTGTFEILCAELCGVGHHAMRGTVVVESEADFNRWMGEQMTFGQILAGTEGDSKVQLAQASAPRTGER